jgi:lipoprotein-anchoring transpeptidase ErfK/SrfK
MRRLALAVAAAVTLLAGCGGGDTATPPTPTATATTATAAPTPTGIETAARGTATIATIRTGLKQLIARADAATTAKPAATLPARTARYGSPTTLLVVGGKPGWLKVQLPTRPNGSTGWVTVADVTIAPTADTITVDLAKRTITITVGGKTTVAPAAIGSKTNPTPTGRHYVTDRVKPEPKSPYGTFALGLSAHSDTLSEFGGGDGQIGIHGTNDPASIGKDVTHGCIRVNPATAKLLEQVGLGTPVTVK